MSMDSGIAMDVRPKEPRWSLGDAVIVTVALALLIGLIGWGLVSWWKDAALERAKTHLGAQAEQRIAALLPAWRETETDKDTLIEWSGTGAALLYLQEYCHRDLFGECDEPFWDAYARSPNGQLFKLEVWISDDLQFVVNRHERVTRDQLLAVLDESKQYALIQKLGFATRRFDEVRSDATPH